MDNGLCERMLFQLRTFIVFYCGLLWSLQWNRLYICWLDEWTSFDSQGFAEQFAQMGKFKRAGIEQEEIFLLMSTSAFAWLRQEKLDFSLSLLYGLSYESLCGYAQVGCMRACINEFSAFTDMSFCLSVSISLSKNTHTWVCGYEYLCKLQKRFLVKLL